MRRLHVVGKHEKFVASGMYWIYAGDEPTGLVEHWSIHEVGGAQFIRVDVDGRDFDGSSTLMEALRTPDGQFERVDVYFYEASRSQPVKVSYTFFEEHIEIVRPMNSGVCDESIEMPRNYGVWMNSSIMQGFTVAQAARHNHPVPLFRSMIEDGELTYSTTAVLHLTPLGDEQIQVAGREINVTGYSWNENAAMWLDQHQILVKSTAPSTQMLLAQYARRPEPKTDV